MSWLSDLASKAENFLNTLDHSAAEVLKANNNEHQPVDDDTNNYYHKTNILSTSHDLHSNVQLSSSHHSRYDMPVTIKPVDMLEGIITGCQSFSSEEGGGKHFSASSNQLSSSSDAFKLSHSTTHSGQGDQNEMSRSKSKSVKKTINSEQNSSDDLDLFDFLNNNSKAVSIHSNSSSMGRDPTKYDSLLSNTNRIEEDQSSGYETSLSTKNTDSYVTKTENVDDDSCAKVATAPPPPPPTTTTATALTGGEPPVKKSITITEETVNKSSNNQLSIVNDLRLENKLLRSEVSSLSQEVSGLLRRNHKASEEIKQLTGQIDRLNNQLKDSDTRVRELQIKLKETELSKKSFDDTSNNNKNIIIEQLENKVKATESKLSTAQNDLNHLQSQVEKNKLTINTLEANLHESRQQTLIADKRTELAQNDNIRLARELTQYKEKANHILAMKERVIASLRGQEMSSDGSQNILSNEENTENELINSIRAECDLLREEASRWRLEVDHREMAIQELELQMQTERESLRRNIELYEQQAEREKQLREEADTELAHLRQSIRQSEETFSRQKAELHTKLMSTESELNRLRQLASSASNESSASSRQSIPSRSDPENILTLESRIRQLTDNLLSKQDALDSVLAQNHALKIRLDRVMNDNESLVSALSSDDAQLILENGRPYQSVGYGCTRLNLHNSPMPKQLKLLAYRIDNFGIRMANTFRRIPIIRLITISYLLLLHIWMILSFLLPVNNTTTTVSMSNSKLPADQNSPVVVDSVNQIPVVLNKP
ncbi:unnamed protein product [Trichobilharzia szidati]|nr:unnamed protein product [Trichobilharzia szidati]